MDLSSSKLLNEAVEQMSILPGVGKKTALRFVLNLLKKDQGDVERFAKAFLDLKENVRFCNTCHNLSDGDECSICASKSRMKSLVCVVEDIRDILSIENTQQYSGYYHVLGGVISPMDGLGPNDLAIDTLLSRVRKGDIKEVILALSTTMEGDTTNFYLYKKLASFDIKVSTLSRGVAVGDELHYADELTLGSSIMNRTPYENALLK